MPPAADAVSAELKFALVLAASLAGMCAGLEGDGLMLALFARRSRC
jgi:hypothetical protein